MKKLKVTLLPALLAALILGGCSPESKKVASQGAQYEIFVICPTAQWKGAVGDSVRSILGAPVEMINQTEPMFDLFHAPAFEGLVLKHRNLLQVKIDPQYTEPRILAAYDVQVAPQILVTVMGPSSSSVITYMDEHRDELQKVFNIAERDRMVAQNQKYFEGGIEKEVKKVFGIDMKVPKGYRLRSQDKDFVWISYEWPMASQGFFVYSYPYTGKENFTEEALLARRNEFAKRIPGPSEKSYMTTNGEFPPELKHQRIDGRYWAEMRGFWDVEGDFMGGPYVSYSTVDLTSRRVVTIDCYVFSPKNPKRNYLRGLESLIYTVTFPGDAEAKAAAE